MFDISLPTDLLATAVAQRPVGVVVNRLVGMGLKDVQRLGNGCLEFTKDIILEYLNTNIPFIRLGILPHL